MQSHTQHNYWNRTAGEKNFTHPLDLELIEKLVAKDGLIVDYGCGYGRLVKILNEAGYTHVAGFDTSQGLISRGKQEGVSNLFHIVSPGELPVAENTLDCILLVAVLTCIPSNSEQKELIRILHSKLSPGGVIYISDYYLQEHSTETERYSNLDDDQENFGVFTIHEGITFRHHTMEWIALLMKDFCDITESAFQVKTMKGHDAIAFRMVGRKKNIFDNSDEMS